MAKPKAKEKAAKSVPVKTSFFLDDRKVGWLLAGFAFILYIQASGYGFALDDRAVTYQNKFVMDGFGGFGRILKTFYWAGFWDSNAGLFRPVSLLLFATEWAFVQNNPHVFHFVQVLLYAVCAYLLYRTLRDLFRDQSVTLALFATVFWIVMPVHTEVAANVKSGDEVLSLLFFLLSFRQLLKWSDSGKLQQLGYSSLFLFLSLLSKEGAVLFIPVMLLALMLFRNKKVKELFIPTGALAVVTAIWLGWHSWVIAHAPTEMITYDYHNNSLFATSSFMTQLGTAIGMQGRYWMKMVAGFPLSYDYSFNEIPVNGFADGWAIFSLLVILGAIYFAFKNFKTAPVLSFGILFYFITFALTSNIFYLIGATMADRLTFVPSIGFAIVVSWLVLKFTNGLEEKRIHTKAMYVLIPLTLIYSIRTFARSQAWETEKNLFITDVENSPNSARVNSNYAIVQMDTAQKIAEGPFRRQILDDAYVHLKTAFTIDTGDWGVCENLGVVEYRRGNYKASASWSSYILKRWPVKKDVLNNLADAQLKYQQYDSAIANYREAMHAKVAGSANWTRMGDCYLLKGDTASALNTFKEAVAADSTLADAWDKLANISGMRGDYKTSTAAFEKLAQLKPEDPRPVYMIYSNYLREGDTARANTYLPEFHKRGGK